MPREEMLARLAAQQHRRFIKTHTPLDGIPIDPRATYIVVARHPLDMAVSLYHQGNNIDRARLRRLTGQPEPSEPPPPRPPLHDWLTSLDPRGHHAAAADGLAARGDVAPDRRLGRRGQPNIVLAHYDDLSAGLAGEMRRLAARLGITVPAGDVAGPGPGGHVRGDAGRRRAPDRAARRPEEQRRLLPAGHVGGRARGAQRG